jgi:general secretion pathway protein K
MIMGRFLRNSRGMALILTILIVSLIVALTLEFNRTMRTHVVSAGHIGHGLQALYAAKSGVSCGLAVLKEDDRSADTLLDDWASQEVIGAISAASRTLFAGGYFELEIEDLSGKIQVNSLLDNEALAVAFKRFLELPEFGLDVEQAKTIVESVMDWIDREDELLRLDGAEDDYYMSLDRPYHCKNGPLDSPEELLLVKGVTPELFYGTEDHASIAPYISVFGNGRININTADPKFPASPPLVLRSLHEEMSLSDSMAEDMANYRQEATEDELASTQWYSQVLPDDIKIPNELITTASNYFQITSVGHFGDTSRRVEAVVERSISGFKLLSWKIG